MSAADKRRLASLDPRPIALRAAMKRNTQMNRQLSRVRNSLRNEERESQQLLNRGNHQLIAKLNALRIIKEIKSPLPPVQKVPDAVARKESLDKINIRSNSQRRKLYRQPTQSVIETSETKLQEEGSEQQQQEKYQIPSWKRAEMMMKQQREEEKNSKIYGRRGAGGGRGRPGNALKSK